MAGVDARVEDRLAGLLAVEKQRHAVRCMHERAPCDHTQLLLSEHSDSGYED